MSDQTDRKQFNRRCVLHMDSKSTNEQVKEFDELSWRKVKTVDSYRRQHSQSSKYLSVKLPDDLNDSIGYHTTCYKNFTAISITPEVDTFEKQYVLRSDVEGASPGLGIFPPVCLFCGNAKKSKGRHGKEPLGNCETQAAAKSIFDTAVSLNDVEMLARISGVDMIAKEVKYHHSCKRSYLHKAPRKETTALQVDSDSSGHDFAFKSLKDHITETLIEAEGAELLTSLHAKYMNHLGVESSYSANTLREKIMKTYPQLKQCKQSNKQGVIIYNAALCEETAVKRATFDHNSIIEAAFYLRGLIKDIQKTLCDLPETLSADILCKGQAAPPEDLLKFFRVLYTGSSGNDSFCSCKLLIFKEIRYPLIFFLFLLLYSYFYCRC